MTSRLRAPIVSFALFLGLAVVAYVATLLIVYPRFFAPFSAFHSDMYMPVDFVARGVPLDYLVRWPRPVYWVTLLAGGHLGFKGSLVFFTALLFAALSLSLLVVERFAVRASIPLWIAFSTFLLTFSGPAMYFEPGLDIGYTLALLFGMLGIYAWEARVSEKPWTAYALTALCFLLSVLSKESFLPALIVYGIAAAIRDRRTPAVAIAIAVLPVAVAVAGITETAHARFVNPAASASNPYFMSFAPGTMWALWTYYTAPLWNPYVLLLVAGCFTCIWMQRRVWTGIATFVAALAMYLPYLVLPNHRIYFYECVAMPLLALLVPLALTPDGALSGEPARRFRIVQAMTYIWTIFAAVMLGVQNRHDPEQNWGLTQQAINRNAYKAIVADQSQISSAHSVLVTGLSYPYHPWIYPAFLGPLLHFTGEWTIVHEPPYAPVEGQPHARSIEARDVRPHDYDLILAFNDKGELAKTSAIASATPVPAFSYPGGLVLPSDEAAAVRHGVYPAAGGETCCFLAKSATIVLAKPAGATTAIFTFFVPDFAPFANASERVAMTFDGIAVRPAEISKGLHEVAVSLPRALANKANVNAFLEMTIAYVPADVGINGDTRTLSIVLTQVRFR